MILKLIWSKEQALKENLLTTNEAKQIQRTLWDFLDKNLSSDSIVGLRYRKLKGSKKSTWWTDANGYPSGNPWNDMIEPFFKILEQHIAGKTIKRKLTVDNLFAESRIQGEDEHILVGEKDGSGNKAHIIIDGKTGEIRADDNDQAPEEVLSKIETVLTLKNGKKIKTTREAMKELQDNKPQENKEQKVHDEDLMDKLYLSRKIKGIYSLGEIYNLSTEDILDLNILLDYVDKSGTHQTLKGKVINSFDEPIRATPVNPTIIKQKDNLHITDFPRVSVKVIISGTLSKTKKEYRQEFNIPEHQK